jgi:toxin ParE1/3/4
MPRVKLSNDAKMDLDEIGYHIAQDNPLAAKRFAAKIRKKYRLLGKHPGLGERCDEVSPGTRRTFVGNYVLLYRHDGSTVEIIRIIRGERDINSSGT